MTVYMVATFVVNFDLCEGVSRDGRICPEVGSFLGYPWHQAYSILLGIKDTTCTHNMWITPVVHWSKYMYIDSTFTSNSSSTFVRYFMLILWSSGKQLCIQQLELGIIASWRVCRFTHETNLLLMLWSRLSSLWSLRASWWSSPSFFSFLLKCCLFIHSNFLSTVIGLLFKPSRVNRSTSSLRVNISCGLNWFGTGDDSCAETWVPPCGLQPRRAMKLTTASGRYPFSFKKCTKFGHIRYSRSEPHTACEVLMNIPCRSQQKCLCFFSIACHLNYIWMKNTIKLVYL